MISLFFSLIVTFNAAFNCSNTTSPVKEQKNIEDYFKLVRKASGAKPLEYKVIEMASDNRYMRISYLEEGEPSITEFYYWPLGLDFDSDHVLLAYVTFREGYSTMPGFYTYKDGDIAEAKYSKIITNWDTLLEFNESFEQNKTSDKFCCDLRVFLPKDGSDDLSIYSVKDEVAVKLKDRPSKDKCRKIGTLKYDILLETFEFEVD
jgi:hypothetical protein